MFSPNNYNFDKNDNDPRRLTPRSFAGALGNLRNSEAPTQASNARLNDYRQRVSQVNQSAVLKKVNIPVRSGHQDKALNSIRNRLQFGQQDSYQHEVENQIVPVRVFKTPHTIQQPLLPHAPLSDNNRIYEEGFHEQNNQNNFYKLVKMPAKIDKEKVKWNFWKNRNKSKTKNRPKIVHTLRWKQSLVAAILLISGVSLFAFNFSNIVQSDNNTKGVAGAVEYKANDTQTDIQTSTPTDTSTASSIDESSYRTWITEKNSGQFVPSTEDLDSDGLKNSDEFLLQTNPNSANTCSDTKTDSQNLLDLIDPSNCQSIDLENDEQFSKFSLVLNVDAIKEQFYADLDKPEAVTPTEEEVVVVPGTVADKEFSLLGVFKVKSFAELDKLDRKKLPADKLKYLETVDKIGKYIKQYRSYDAYDRNFEPPVHPAVYLDVSIRYQTPLKYVMAIARLESRFGTDRYTSDGGLTRPGKYKNIYSMGLTDHGTNLQFDNWEKGVESFGKWYTRLHNKKISNCRKWSIYNPNGDYCGKVENLSREIHDYFGELIIDKN